MAAAVREAVGCSRPAGQGMAAAAEAEMAVAGCIRLAGPERAAAAREAAG